MSTTVVTWSSTTSSPNQVYNGNVAYLRNVTNEKIQEIKDRIENNKELFSESEIEEILEIQIFVEELIKGYTKKIVNSPNHKEFLENIISDFNDAVLAAKNKINYLLLEAKEDKIRLDEEIASLKRKLNDTGFSLMLEQDDSKIVTINNKISSLVAMKRPKDGLKNVKDLEKMIDDLDSFIKKTIEDFHVKERNLTESLNSFTGRIEESGFTDLVQKIQTKIPQIKEITNFNKRNDMINAITEDIQKLYHDLNIAESIDLSLLQEDNIQKPIIVDQDAVELGNYQKKIEFFYHRMKVISDNELNHLEHFIKELNNISSIQRMELIYSDIGDQYVKLKKQASLMETYRDELKFMSNQISGFNNCDDLLFKLNKALQNTIILDSEFNILRSEYNSFLVEHQKRSKEINNRGKVLEEIVATLKSMGYSVNPRSSGINITELKGNEQIFLNGISQGYQIMLMVNPSGEYVTKLVRTVGSEKEKELVTNTQRQKDIEVGKLWCNKYEQFKKILSSNGIQLEERIRLEPETSELLIVVDKTIGFDREIEKEKQSGVLNEQKIGY